MTHIVKSIVSIIKKGYHRLKKRIQTKRRTTRGECHPPITSTTSPNPIERDCEEHCIENPGISPSDDVPVATVAEASRLIHAIAVHDILEIEDLVKECATVKDKSIGN